MIRVLRTGTWRQPCRQFIGLLLSVMAVLCQPAYAQPDRPIFQDELAPGDLVFQSLSSRQSVVLEAVTGSSITHMGMVIETTSGWAVIEAVGPVQIVPLADWVAQGTGRRVAVKRFPGLDPADARQIEAAARAMLGRRYDFLFQWDDRAIYCSELVYDAYVRGADISLGTVRALGSYDLSGPKTRDLFVERFGIEPGDPAAEPALQEPVIAPDAIYADPRLITIHDAFDGSD